jgi:sulfide:quinone oxidoreductase
MTGARSPDGGPLRVVIVGGGIAALEAVLALHDLAGDRVAVTLVAPDTTFTLRPLTVAVPFGLGPIGDVPLTEVMAEHGGTFVQAAAEAVDPAARTVRCDNDDVLPYDALLLALGARTARALPAEITFDTRSPDALATITGAVKVGWARTVAFVVPGGTTWPLPLYELALMAARELAGRDGLDLHLVTPESNPLAVFGPEASAAVAGLLRDAGVTFHGGVATRMIADHELDVGAAMPLLVDRIVALPVLSGWALPGVPADRQGFVPIDARGRVRGLDHAWAVGDGTDQLIKQGGVACQQADAFAAQIAAHTAGDPVPDPAPLVLRARLFAGDHDLLLERSTDARHSAHVDSLLPPTGHVYDKVNSRYLTPYLRSKEFADWRPDPGG